MNEKEARDGRWTKAGLKGKRSKLYEPATPSMQVTSRYIAAVEQRFGHQVAKSTGVTGSIS